MFLQNLKQITTFILDIDGVLTNGQLLATESGELLRSFNVKDGYAMQVALKQGFKICIISGAKGIALTKRFKGLGIKHVYLAIDDKIATFNAFLKEQNLSANEILYMGDDIPDMEVMSLVKIATCPADAVEEVKQISQYISPKNGGQGAVRDVIEKVLRVQNLWLNTQISAATASK